MIVIGAAAFLLIAFAYACVTALMAWAWFKMKGERAFAGWPSTALLCVLIATASAPCGCAIASMPLDIYLGDGGRMVTKPRWIEDPLLAYAVCWGGMLVLAGAALWLRKKAGRPAGQP